MPLVIFFAFTTPTRTFAEQIGFIGYFNQPSLFFLCQTRVIPVSYTHLDVYKRQIRTYEDSTGVKVETEDTIEAEEAAKDGSAVKHQIPAEVKRSMGFLLASIFLWFTAYKMCIRDSGCSPRCRAVYRRLPDGNGKCRRSLHHMGFD